MQTDPNWANFFYNHEQKKVLLYIYRAISTLLFFRFVLCTHSSFSFLFLQLHVLDFGASRSFSEKFIQGYFAVIHAAVRGDRMGVLESSRTLGFLTGEETDVMNNAHIDAGISPPPLPSPLFSTLASPLPLSPSLLIYFYYSSDDTGRTLCHTRRV